MRQLEEDDQQQQLIQEAHQRFEQSRQARAKVEGKCLLGFVVWTIVQQAMSQSPTHIPGSSQPAAVDKEK